MAHIDVYASLPRTVALGADLDVDPDNWDWIHCLTLPIEKLNALNFSQRPYKWIRYAIGVVIGAEGVLSTTPDPSNLVDYNAAALPAEFTNLYYHTSNDEKRRMFPVDPDMARTHVTSSVASTRRVHFREDVERRDGGCVLTGTRAVGCDAAHLLAHVKGDMYISTCTQRRSRSPTEDDIIREIDSIRNGLFLNKVAHASLGKEIAFLMTPNFAMDSTDINLPTAQAAEQRCTSHVFITPLIPSDHFHFNPGSTLQISDTPEYPPAILFDALYAGVVLLHFGTQTLKATVAASWKDVFYPDGVVNVAHADQKSLEDKRASALEKKQKQAEEQQECYDAHHTPDTFDMLMMLPYVLVLPNELQSMLRAAKEKAEAVEQRCVHEKVDNWVRKVDAG